MRSSRLKLRLYPSVIEFLSGAFKHLQSACGVSDGAGLQAGGVGAVALTEFHGDGRSV